MKELCRKARYYINRYFDEKAPMPGWVEDHLKVCAECNKFKKSFEETTKKLKISIDEAICKIAPLDFSIIEDRMFKRKRNVRIAKLSATTVCVAVLSFFIYYRYFYHKINKSDIEKILMKKLLIREENNQFIESIFNTSFFDANSNSHEITFSTDLFNSSENILNIDSDAIIDE